MTDVTPANASFPSKVSPTKPEKAGRSSLKAAAADTLDRKLEGTRTPSKTQGGEEHTQPNGTSAAHTPGGKQSGVRKVNRERDLKVKEMGTCPPFLEGGRGHVVMCKRGGEAKVALPESGVLEGRF